MTAIVQRFSYSGPSLPVTLDPGQSLAGDVTFTPTAARMYAGTIVFKLAVGARVDATVSGSGVDIAPSIATEPTNQNVTAGQTATFSATASGTAPLSYRWRENGRAIAGATEQSYT